MHLFGNSVDHAFRQLPVTVHLDHRSDLVVSRNFPGEVLGGGFGLVINEAVKC